MTMHKSSVCVAWTKCHITAEFAERSTVHYHYCIFSIFFTNHISLIYNGCDEHKNTW